MNHISKHFIKCTAKKRINEFNNISLIIDYFNLQLNSLWKTVESAQANDLRRKDEYIKTSNNVIESIARILYHPPKDFNKEDNNKVNLFLIEYYNNLNINDLSYNYNYIRKALNEIFSEHISNSELLEIISEIKKASIMFNEINLQNEFHKNELIRIRNQMQISLNNYLNNINRLQ